jgi:hypothetical protein
MSNINPQNIDGTYPIAGQDNNSQGFRDNFTNTVNNFTFAAAELTDLQTYAVLKGPLGSVGQTGTPTNVMDYTFITEPQLLKAVETKKDMGSISSGSSFEVDWSQGHFQTVSITTTAGMTFASTWPTTDLWTRLRLQVTATTLSNLTISGTYIENISSIQGNYAGNVIQLGTGVYVFELSTYDAGAHVWIQDVLRNYDIVANGASSTFATVTAGTVNAVTIGNAGATVTGTTGAFSGNVIGGLARFAAINSTPIGNATPSTGAFSTLSASGLTTLTGGISGNVVINDPIGAGSFGSNLTVKGTVEFKSQDQSNNASVNTSTKSLTLAPGGDQFLLLNINGNCSIGYNATITPGHQTTVHVKNSAGALAYVIVPNENTNTGNAFIGLATGITGTFVFTSYGTDAGNVFVTVSR